MEADYKRKTIRYPKGIHKDLLVRAAKKGLDLTKYIESLLIEDSKKS